MREKKGEKFFFSHSNLKCVLRNKGEEKKLTYARIQHLTKNVKMKSKRDIEKERGIKNCCGEKEEENREGKKNLFLLCCANAKDFWWTWEISSLLLPTKKRFLPFFSPFLAHSTLFRCLRFFLLWMNCQVIKELRSSFKVVIVWLKVEWIRSRKNNRSLIESAIIIINFHFLF